MARFYIEIRGDDVTSGFSELSTSISVTDSSGGGADSASIAVDDTDGSIVLPKKGDPITIGLGVIEPVVVFEGTIEKVTSSGGRSGGGSLAITAKSADTGNGKAKKPMQKHKDDAKLEDVVKEWGKDAGIDEASIHPDLASVERPYWSMNGESFMAWGERTARQLGATFKIMGRRVVMVPRSAGVSTDGQPLTKISATRPGNLIDWSLDTDRGRPEHSKFKTRRFDADEAEWTEEEEDSEYETDSESEDYARFSEAGQDSAKSRSKSRAKESSRERGGGSIRIDGEPAAQAEGTVILSGARPGVDGEWLIDSVTHSLSRSQGFTTSLTVKLPGSDVGKDNRQSQPAGEEKAGKTPTDSATSPKPSTGAGSATVPTQSNPRPSGIGSDAGAGGRA